VNCAGMWARQFGQDCGVNIPNQAAEHYYLLTDAISEVDPSWPIIEDPASYTYIRPEVYTSKLSWKPVVINYCSLLFSFSLSVGGRADGRSI